MGVQKGQLVQMFAPAGAGMMRHRIGDLGQKFKSYALVVESARKPWIDMVKISENIFDDTFTTYMQDTLQCNASTFKGDMLTDLGAADYEAACLAYKTDACILFSAYTTYAENQTSVMQAGGCTASLWQPANDRRLSTTQSSSTDDHPASRSAMMFFWRQKIDDAKKVSRCMEAWGTSSTVYDVNDLDGEDGLPKHTAGGHFSWYDLECIARAYEYPTYPVGAEGVGVNFVAPHGKAMKKLYDTLRAQPDHAYYAGGSSPLRDGGLAAHDFSMYHIGGMSQTTSYTP